ncbi:hypothetical protein [Streptomyces sp. RKAG293]|uniref:hypothetical protein n=1 Tax=Streptomyces sp. RKAG293 TaxID=2893403 RepID=UPI00203321C7|nr:hypothetical protein [Streptomyces sp. RKAG293]MCM2423772.1 hypothetical protein [Streptomyces sp. RKAG293]
MIAYIAPLWIFGVGCLVASVVGKAVKLGGVEIPAITTTWAQLVVALVGVAAIVLGTVLFQHEGSPSAAGSSAAVPSGGSSVSGASAPPQAPTPDPPPTSTTAPSTTTPPPSAEPPTPPATEPPASTAPAAVHVRWQGTLTLDDGSASGSPITGWSLDSVPPLRAPMGDLGLACQLSCEPGQIVGTTVVSWSGAAPPQREQCVTLLNTHLGQRTADVTPGSIVCFGTDGGRVGFFTAGGTAGAGRQTLAVTVWERP